jgi:hypothetical protein
LPIHEFHKFQWQALNFMAPRIAGKNRFWAKKKKQQGKENLDLV